MKIKLDWDWEYLEDLENEHMKKQTKIKNDKDFQKWIKEQKKENNNTSE